MEGGEKAGVGEKGLDFFHSCLCLFVCWFVFFLCRCGAIFYVSACRSLRRKDDALVRVCLSRMRVYRCLWHADVEEGEGEKGREGGAWRIINEG